MSAIPQSEAYHDFVNQREFLGIANTLNVISNFPFFIIGVIDFTHLYHRNYFKLSLRGELWGWTCFFVGVTTIAFGSGYYHLKPNDAYLVWDRLGTSATSSPGLLSTLSFLVHSTLDFYKFFDSLRPYVLVQFVPCIAIPLMAILLPPMYTHSTYWLWAAGLVSLLKTWKICWTKIKGNEIKGESYTCIYTNVPVVESS
ncbi:hypothetical protein K2173_018467 [Erythroxylum novogranatense]|uniref:Uncharacterized protein n=1 Tax=Erythroxylum novogranatense TaxID=1862640 RepID=A0AAV8UAQ9_9ROSI|nr:hypothetical protein K2173_018467 [Erythroxylum novogranatense]